MPRPTTDKKGFIPAPGVAQVEMIYSHLGVIMENVYHVVDNNAAPDPDAARLNVIAGIFNNWETTQMIPYRSIRCKLQLIRARQLGVKDGVVMEITPVGAVTGTNTTAPCAGNVTFASKWTTARGGRSYRGRTYHIGMTDDMKDGNQLVNTTVTQLVSKYAALITAVNAQAGLKLAVLSYANNKFWRDAAVATPIVSVSADVNVDSQRRRLTGRGS